MLAAGERPDFDPSMAAIRPPYTAMFNDYVRRELGFKSDLTYHILGGGIGAWDWGSAGNGFADVSEPLRSAFAEEPAHEAVRGLGLLRPRDAVLRDRSTRSATWGWTRRCGPASARATTRPAT